MDNVLILTQEGPEGIRYDFVNGCRVWVPEGARWRVQLRDIETNSILFQKDLQGSGLVQSAKRYYIRFGIVVWKNDQIVFEHECNLNARDVLISMELGGLGDHIAWMGHAIAFAEQHQCRLSCCISAPLIPLFDRVYPDVRFITKLDIDRYNYYAHYRVLVFFEDHNHDYQPNDYRQSGLAHMGAYILGLSPKERAPKVAVDPGGRPIKEPYVCVGTHASGLSKYWNNPVGWHEVVKFLKQSGYRVICIDRDRIGGKGPAVRTIPYGVEDQTGARSLSERARWLKYADFFVGLSSGLSWLAWTVETPVVMISGFTEPYNEFYTPYRVINRHVCNSCANDINIRLRPEEQFFCPRHKDTERMFECGRSITPQHVTSVIQTIPGFGGHK